MEITDIIRIVGGFGGTALIIWIARYCADHWRWYRFLRKLPTRLEELAEESARFVGPSLRDMTDDQWSSECGSLLVESGYAPREIKDLGLLPVQTAKSLAFDMFLLGDDDDRPASA